MLEADDDATADDDALPLSALEYDCAPVFELLVQLLCELDGEAVPDREIGAEREAFELTEFDAEVFADADAVTSSEAIADSEGDGERVCALDSLLDSVLLAVLESAEEELREIFVVGLAAGVGLEDDCRDPVCERDDEADEDFDRLEETDDDGDGV